MAKGIAIGTFGVAIDRNKNIAVPFVVGDGGPRVGEGSAALARLVAGKPVSDQLTRKTASVGQVDNPDVLLGFFGGQPTTYDHIDEGKLATDANKLMRSGAAKRGCALVWLRFQRTEIKPGCLALSPAFGEGWKDLCRP